MVIDCKTMSKDIRSIIRRECENKGLKPGLAVIVVGDDPASMTYVNNKQKACDEVGFYSAILKLPKTVTTEDVISAVKNFAERKDIHGVMVQLPMPKHISERDVIAAIPPEKDVDALTPSSLGKTVTGNYDFASCTPIGIITILKESGYNLAGTNCVVIGRSNIVGKPMAALLTQEDATVTLCHSKTRNLADITGKADIVICAVGKENFLTANMVSANAVVIDVGINRDQNGKLVGDVSKEAAQKVSAITPVPGGVGVMTVTSLLVNTYKAALLSKN